MVVDILIKMKFEPVSNFEDKNISLSVILDGWKLFDVATATVGLTWPYSPSLGASMKINLGWIDAAISV
jgi:hypothetical protein